MDDVVLVIDRQLHRHAWGDGRDRGPRRLTAVSCWSMRRQTAMQDKHDITVEPIDQEPTGRQAMQHQEAIEQVVRHQAHSIVVRFGSLLSRCSPGAGSGASGREGMHLEAYLPWR